MTAAALALVIPSAAAHAGWNLLAKSSGGGLGFIWLGNLVSLAVMIPAAIVAASIAGTGGIDATTVAWMAGAATLHGTYLLTLQNGYRAADLSVVYPLARGTGPLLAFVAAVALLGRVARRRSRCSVPRRSSGPSCRSGCRRRAEST